MKKQVEVEELEWRVWYDKPKSGDRVEILYVADNKRFLGVYQRGEFMTNNKRNSVVFAKPFLWRHRK